MTTDENSHLKSLNDRIKINDDVFFAISEKNKDKLLNALNNGFTFDDVYKSTKSNKQKVIDNLYNDNTDDDNFHNDVVIRENAKNVYPLINVISSGWNEGWEILYDRFLKNVDFSKAKEFPAIWEVALHYANISVLKDIEKLGFDPKIKNSSGLSSIHILFESLNYTDLVQIAPSKVIEVAFWLQSKGLDLYEAYPGKYMDIRDGKKAGHSIWTYALREKNYDVFYHLLPSSWLNIIKSPKWKHYIKIFINELKNPLRTDREKDVLNKSWFKFKDNFFELILEEYKPEFNTVDDISIFVSYLNKEQRLLFWEYINEAQEYGRSLWFTLAQDIYNVKLYNLISKANSDGFDIAGAFLKHDTVNDTALDMWICYFEAIPVNSIPNDDLLNIQMDFYTKTFSKESRTAINAEKGFSFNDFIGSKISSWAKYDKKYQAQLDKLIN